MFIECLLWGFLWATIIVVPLAAITTLGSTKASNVLITGICLWVVCGFVACFLFWWVVPTSGFNQITLYKHYWLIWWLMAVIGVVLGLVGSGDKSPSAGSYVVAMLLVVLLGYGALFLPVLTDKEAKTLAQQVDVKMEPNSSYPDTDPNHMLLVSEETADFKANQVLASSKQHNLGTIYEVGDGILQSVDNHLYWIYGLVPTGYRNSNRLKDLHGDVPGFVRVDAEDPNPPAQLMLEDPSGKPYRIKYYRGGYLGQKFERYLWNNGYRSQSLGELVLEVDDNWQPYYTAAINKVTVGRSLFAPKEMLRVNPTTGSTNTYPIGKAPEWVDRVYSKGMVEKMLNYWGRWAQANRNIFKEASANRYKVAPDEDPVLVYTKGGHPVWQAIMTSYSKDTAAAYLALFDARDNTVRMYEIPNLTLAETAADTIRHSNSNLKGLEPVHMTLHRIYGQLTWVAPLIKPHSAGSATTSSASQGLALLRADDLNGGSVALAGNKADALEQYREKLAAGNSNASPEENSNYKSAGGKVGRVNQLVEGGNTVFYFTLSGDPDHLYHATTGRNGQGDTNLELPLIKIGAHVRVTFLDVGSPRRDVAGYDDLGLTISNK
jgi:hypothetical protein